MKIFRGYEDDGIPGGMVLGIGNFDGLHLGHQAVIQEVVKEAGEAKVPSGLLTFHPHPMEVIGAESSPGLIYTAEEKEKILGRAGVDVVVYQSFDRDFAAMSPECFVREVLFWRLAPMTVVVGHDFRFGAGGSGDVGLLEKIGRQCGFKTVVIGEVVIGGLPVRSSRIRDLIIEGRMTEAALLLGRPYHLTGKVFRSDGIGIKTGFPTANIMPPDKLVPPDGVYAGLVSLEGEPHPAAINIGIPMKRGVKRMVECHMPGFEGDIYGCIIEVAFVERIREERSFASLEELSGQIAKDVSRVLRIMGGKKG